MISSIDQSSRCDRSCPQYRYWKWPRRYAFFHSRDRSRIRTVVNQLLLLKLLEWIVVQNKWLAKREGLNSLSSSLANETAWENSDDFGLRGNSARHKYAKLAVNFNSKLTTDFDICWTHAIKICSMKVFLTKGSRSDGAVLRNRYQSFLQNCWDLQVYHPINFLFHILHVSWID